MFTLRSLELRELQIKRLWLPKIGLQSDPSLLHLISVAVALTGSLVTVNSMWNLSI